MEDGQVLGHIDVLAKEELRLYEQEKLSEAERTRLRRITVELDQCWDLLRQRRGLRDADADPDTAKVRPPDIVERYEA
jgi:Protein of unknown function (DUF2630)